MGAHLGERQLTATPDEAAAAASVGLVELGSVGVWWSGPWTTPGDPALDVPAELEALGYGALWSSGGIWPGLSWRFERLLGSTSAIVVASGIVSIWKADAPRLAAADEDLEARHRGRFLLGLGASHAPLVEGYTRPYTRMVSYLDALDATAPSVPAQRRALAALGPKMLRLAADRSLGAHPYFVPVDHTARAREVLGDGPLLAPEVTVVLERDPTTARSRARAFTAGYLGLPNYVNNLRALGFGDDDVAGAGSDRLVDAVVAWGDLEAVSARIQAHLDAGADHVCIQVVGAGEGFPIRHYRELAAALLPR